jgi:glyoxylase I family protein
MNMAIEVKGMTPLLQVFDMPSSMKFYCEVLGFEVVTVDDPKKAPNHDWVWLRLNDADLMLNTAYERDERPPAPEPRRHAAHDDTCLYFGAPNVDAVYGDLTAKGLKLNKPKVAWYGMKQLYLKDPDGFGLCFQWKADNGA